MPKASARKAAAPKTRRKTAMSKREDDERAEKARAAKEKSDHDTKKQQQLEAEGKRQAKANEATSPYGETPKVGSLDPGRTTMANPPPQNVPMDPIEPTDDPMATPSASPLPNPPSRPGGDPTGSPNYSATGEKLDPSHPDYREDVEDYHAPDHRSAEEKKADPRK